MTGVGGCRGKRCCISEAFKCCHMSPWPKSTGGKIVCFVYHFHHLGNQDRNGEAGTNVESLRSAACWLSSPWLPQLVSIQCPGLVLPTVSWIYHPSEKCTTCLLTENGGIFFHLRVPLPECLGSSWHKTNKHRLSQWTNGSGSFCDVRLSIRLNSFCKKQKTFTVCEV